MNHEAEASIRPGEPVIEGKDLRVSRGNAAILDVPYIAVKEGEVLSVIGPNGAGKTTLIQSLAHLVTPFEGSVLFRGRRVGADLAVLAFRRALAVAFQEPLLFDTSVLENVASGLRIRGLGRSAIADRVEEYLHLFGIAHLSHRSARNLSGGEAQRTSLARAFATKPEVIFLDEPFASLDPGSREPLVDDIQAVLQKTKTTAVLVTHDLMEALRLSDRMAVMGNGKIHQIDTPDEVMDRPADELVAAFVGAGTLLTGRVAESRGGTLSVAVGDREIESTGDITPGEMVSMYIRPEHVTLSVEPEGVDATAALTSARNVFPGTVVRVTALGFYERIHLDCGFPLVSYVTRQSREALQLRPGRSVKASFKATAVHVMRRGPGRT